MIPELTWFALLCVTVIIVAACLAESGTLEETREKRMINRLADRSRKAPEKRRACRWAVSHLSGMGRSKPLGLRRGTMQ